jgi:hypothetical protein
LIHKEGVSVEQEMKRGENERRKAIEAETK